MWMIDFFGGGLMELFRELLRLSGPSLAWRSLGTKYYFLHCRPLLLGKQKMNAAEQSGR